MKIFIGADILNWNSYINLERSNKYAANALKQQEKEIVKLWGRGAKYVGEYPVEIIFRPYFKDCRKDLDNTRVKGLLDGLVACGALKNDNLTCIRRIVIEPKFTKSKGIEIEINGLKSQSCK